MVGPHSGGHDSEDESVTFVGSTVSVPTKGSIAKVSLSLWQNPRVKQIIKRKKFDVIHVHEPFSSVVTLSALGTQVPENVVKIATFHTFEGSRLYRLVSSKLLNRYASEIDGRIAVSEPAKKFISTYIPGNYKIIPNGVNVCDCWATREEKRSYTSSESLSKVNTASRQLTTHRRWRRKFR